jgi:hypothetical protein
MLAARQHPGVNETLASDRHFARTLELGAEKAEIAALCATSGASAKRQGRHNLGEARLR